MIEVLTDNGPDDRAIRIDHRHTVDLGPVNITEATHHARSGEPMEVLYSGAFGYLIAVQTS